MTARLYGRAVGFASHAQVTRGFEQALRGAGQFAGLYAVDRDQPPDAPAPAGATASVGLFTGPLGFLPLMQTAGKHTRRLAMVAPNSNRLPPQLLGALKHVCTEVLVPSRWAKTQVDQAYEGQGPHVRIVPHGVAPEYRAKPEIRLLVRRAYAEGFFRVAHLSSSERGRKGTVELVEAWAILQEEETLPARAVLDLILDPPAYTRMQEYLAERAEGPIQGIALYHRMDLGPPAMAHALAQCHLVCQPSRAEAFGLVPLESLACGVPIAATGCTGHSAWFRDGLPGAMRIAHGADAPIDDIADSVAPSVRPEDIACALRQAGEQWPALHDAALAAAQGVGEEWAWSRQLAPLIAIL